MGKISVKDALRIAVETEQRGDKFYSELSRKYSDNIELREMFEFLAKDEKDHEKQFRKLLDKHGSDETEVGEVDGEFLEAVDLRKFFDKMKDIPEDLDPRDVLQIAFELEREAVLFFSTIRDILGESPELDEIIQIEKGHMTKVMKYIVNYGSRFRGMRDKWT